MRIVLGITNPDVMHNIDVYLDGKLLDSERYGIVSADDVAGCVEYVMFDRTPEGYRHVATEAGMDVKSSDDVIGSIMNAKLFKAQGRVVFDPRPWTPPRSFFDALSEANAARPA
jgi:hypothetical protein